MWFFWGSNTLGKHQLKDLGKLAHKTWTAWAVLHVACRMSTRLLRNIPVFFAFRNSNSWLNALEIRLNTHTKHCKTQTKISYSTNGQTKKTLWGPCDTQKSANEEMNQQQGRYRRRDLVWFTRILCIEELHRRSRLSTQRFYQDSTADSPTRMVL